MRYENGEWEFRLKDSFGITYGSAFEETWVKESSLPHSRKAGAVDV